MLLIFSWSKTTVPIGYIVPSTSTTYCQTYKTSKLPTTFTTTATDYSNAYYYCSQVVQLADFISSHKFLSEIPQDSQSKTVKQ